MKNFGMTNLQAAYRKYKSMIYYDTYAALDREKVADFEAEHHLHEDDSYFTKLSEQLCNQEKREILFSEILSQINVRCYHKKIQNETNPEGLVISNILPKNTTVESLQYQIDLPVARNILRVL